MSKCLITIQDELVGEFVYDPAIVGLSPVGSYVSSTEEPWVTLRKFYLMGMTYVWTKKDSLSRLIDENENQIVVHMYQRIK